MSYAEYTRNNKSKIKQFSHQKRFDVAINLIDIKQEESLLDYGTGDGYLLERLFDNTKNQNLYGYEPVDLMYEELKLTISKNRLQTISISNNLKNIQNKTFDIISCQEVLEHFSEKDQKKTFIKNKKAYS